ncbi:hypothetical protein MVEN_02463700 [Mycena venus]|uniref:Uncharacterized protein n=1 Tax=Mycena venus TaxID=2733690 RepID=A0A8H6WX71_9AGAR|nr:hypothetical protein MVEN_02463700 [Mycena venus]
MTSLDTPSRHPARATAATTGASLLQSPSNLPPYMDAPEYTEKAQDPVTLAMYLFKFGFLFPPFWIMGVIILLSPLRASGCNAVIIDRMRKAELKWAKRCLYALVALVLVAAIISVAVWATLRS